jgi:hypothetical protein
VKLNGRNFFFFNVVLGVGLRFSHLQVLYHLSYTPNPRRLEENVGFGKVELGGRFGRGMKNKDIQVA